MNKALWNLFKETGDLRYYVFLKEMEKVEENYYEKDNSFDCSYSMTIHKTSWLDKFIRNKKNISLDEKMRRAA